MPMPTPNLSVRQPCPTELLEALVAPGAPRRDVRDAGNLAEVGSVPVSPP